MDTEPPVMHISTDEETKYVIDVYCGASEIVLWCTKRELLRGDRYTRNDSNERFTICQTCDQLIDLDLLDALEL